MQALMAKLRTSERHDYAENDKMSSSSTAITHNKVDSINNYQWRETFDPYIIFNCVQPLWGGSLLRSISLNFWLGIVSPNLWQALTLKTGQDIEHTHSGFISR